MAAGRLHHRLQFEVRVLVNDGYGNQVAGDWMAQFDTHCAIRFLKGSETVLASRLEARSPIVITARNCADVRRITHEWRARDLRTSRLYLVKEMPRPTEDRAYFEMLAEAGVAG